MSHGVIVFFFLTFVPFGAFLFADSNSGPLSCEGSLAGFLGATDAPNWGKIADEVFPLIDLPFPSRADRIEKLTSRHLEESLLQASERLKANWRRYRSSVDDMIRTQIIAPYIQKIGSFESFIDPKETLFLLLKSFEKPEDFYRALEFLRAGKTRHRKDSYKTLKKIVERRIALRGPFEETEFPWENGHGLKEHMSIDGIKWLKMSSHPNNYEAETSKDHVALQGLKLEWRVLRRISNGDEFVVAHGAKAAAKLLNFTQKEFTPKTADIISISWDAEAEHYVFNVRECKVLHIFDELAREQIRSTVRLLKERFPSVGIGRLEVAGDGEKLGRPDILNILPHLMDEWVTAIEIDGEFFRLYHRTYKY